ARDKEAVTDLKDALWAPLDVGAVRLPTQPMPGAVQMVPGGIQISPRRPYRGRYNPTPYAFGGSIPQVPESDTGPPQHDGRLPSQFRTSESIRQWQPRLNRIFSFEPPPVPLLQNWRAVENAWPNVEAVRGALSGNKPFPGDVCLISRADANPGSTGISPQNG